MYTRIFLPSGANYSVYAYGNPEVSLAGPRPCSEVSTLFHRFYRVSHDQLLFFYDPDTIKTFYSSLCYFLLFL